MTKQILIFVLLFTSYFAFCQDTLTNKNNFKISILSFVDNAKFKYERIINKKSTIGITASVYYLSPVFGVKTEPTFRYYFKMHAPTGWYLEPKLAIGYFKTKEIFHYYKYAYNASGYIMSEQLQTDDFTKELTFVPIGGSLIAGKQMYFGKNKRFVFDFNFGFQYFPYNYPKEFDNIKYNYGNGTKDVYETIHGSARDAMPVNETIWYILGAGSIFYTNLSIGYNF